MRLIVVTKGWWVGLVPRYTMLGQGEFLICPFTVTISMIAKPLPSKGENLQLVKRTGVHQHTFFAAHFLPAKRQSLLQLTASD